MTSSLSRRACPSSRMRPLGGRRLISVLGMLGGALTGGVLFGLVALAAPLWLAAVLLVACATGAYLAAPPPTIAGLAVAPVSITAASCNRSGLWRSSFSLECKRHHGKVPIAEPLIDYHCHRQPSTQRAAKQSSPAACKARRTSLSASDKANWAEKSSLAMRCSLAACQADTSGLPARASMTYSVPSPNRRARATDEAAASTANRIGDCAGTHWFSNWQVQSLWPARSSFPSSQHSLPSSQSALCR